MAKRTKSSKTQAIRDALSASESGSPSEVAKELNKKGIKVSAAYVSTIKASDKRKAMSGVPPRRPGRPAGSAMSALAEAGSTSSNMMKAIELVLHAGSAAEAQKLVRVACEMVERIHATRA